MDDVDDVLKQLAALRARGRMTEGESRQMHPERETRPRAEPEPRDWQNRLQNRNTNARRIGAVRVGTGQTFGGRNWSGGRER